jgi:hypothetical protein
MPNIQLARVLAHDPQALAQVKMSIAAGNHAYDAPLNRLKREADQALLRGPFSVTDKAFIPPSGDRHDYVSLARYFWPDPNTPDGLPYVSRDGQVNAEIFTIPDHRNFDTLMEDAFTLGLAFYFTDDERYARHAATLLRVWFLDEPTRMNPNLNFCQGIRGLNNGRSAGIIETRELALVVDAIGLLAGSGTWSPADRRGMERWFGVFLEWLRKSELGVQEAQNSNNHGTYYDAQVAALALFLDQTDLARSIVETAMKARIPVQFEPDGRQPLELARTLSWHYCVFNLTAWFRLASLGERLGMDLWNYQTTEGRCLRKALEFLLPFGTGTEWPFREIAPRRFDEFYALLRQAAIKYSAPHYYEASTHVPEVDASSHRIYLMI